MKKMMALVLVLVLVVALLSMGAGARTLTAAEQELFAYIKAGVQVKGETFTLPANIVAQGENWLAASGTELNAAQISAIKAYVDDAKGQIVASGTGDAKKWNDATKSAILTDIDNAAKVVTLSAEATADGGIKVLDQNGATLVKNDHLIQKTGVDVQAFVIAGLCGIAVLSAVAVVSKKAKLF